MFERFTTDARAVVAAARAHADRLGHRPAGTEHLLLALVDTCPVVGQALDGFDVRAAIARHVDSPVDADRDALAALGIDLDRIRAAVDDRFGPGTFAATRRRHAGRRKDARRHTQRAFSPRAVTVLELSLRETLRLKQRAIAPEHIALGLLREGRGLAVLILAEHGVDRTALRRQLEEAARDAEVRPA